jgi:hypothetical protein
MATPNFIHRFIDRLEWGFFLCVEYENCGG